MQLDNMKKNVVPGRTLTPALLAAVLLLDIIGIVQPITAQALTYELDSGATITYVVPTESAPVMVLDSEPLQGFLVIERQPSSPFFGGEYFRVTAIELYTESEAVFYLTSVPPESDPVLAATGGVPASFLVNFTTYGTTAPGIVLAGYGIEPEEGFEGFSMQQTGLMVDARFEGPSAAPTGLDFSRPQPFTPRGAGLYEYHVDCPDPTDPRRCTSRLRLFAVVNFHASIVE
jgi:hypothetical protein